MNKITASVDLTSYREISCFAHQPIAASFRLHAFYRHITDTNTKPFFGVTLGNKKERALRQCGGHFSPCTYLATGPLVHVHHHSDANVPDYERRRVDLTLDCGLPLDVGECLSKLPAPHIKSKDLILGQYISVLGNVGFMLRIDPASRITCTPESASLLDMQPDHVTFGQIIPIEFGQKIHQDPDVLPFPTLFVTFSVETDWKDE